jgi:hypothetical protein
MDESAEAAGGEDRPAGATGGGQVVGRRRADPAAVQPGGQAHFHRPRGGSASAAGRLPVLRRELADQVAGSGRGRTGARRARPGAGCRRSPCRQRRLPSRHHRNLSRSRSRRRPSRTSRSRKRKSPSRRHPSPCPSRAPRVDPFQEQLKREAEQLTQAQAGRNRGAGAGPGQGQPGAAARNKAVADYLGRIRGKIKGNIVLPPDIKGNPEAIFEVTQLPSGEVISVKLKKSSGHAAWMTMPSNAPSSSRARCQNRNKAMFSPIAEYPLPAPGRLGKL